ncbi:DMT family transporter [Terrisporobacter petrolearius]|uniref:DMT family transporter n=1 Tax=Terrisporobacter petrolearius TaxID=1460447 RepID=UPI001D163D97|nr:DMT family transporter [Terrisporobacter petrolearius]MCC3864099.1 DMT family transporter [Terrisporobacter petrolearius]
MKKYLGEIGLFGIAIIWGSGFIGTKLALDGGLSTVQTLTLRFFIASLMLGIIFYKKIKENISKESLIAGALLGLFSFVGFTTQTLGLVYTTVSKNAFITAVNVVIVPFIGFILYKRKLDKIGVISSFMALVGIAVLSLEADLSINFGDFLTFICAIGFAFHIFFTGEFSKKYNSYVLTVTQFVVAFLLSLILQIVIGEINFNATPVGLMGALYLGIFSTAIGFLLQTMCQSKVDQTRTAIILSTEAVFGTIMSVLIFHEVLTSRMVVGCIIIFVSIIVAETKLSFIKKKSVEESTKNLMESQME